MVERAIRETREENTNKLFTVLAPFSGSGTSAPTALQNNCNAIGFEVNPFMNFVGNTKCQQKLKEITEYEKELKNILSQPPFRLCSPLEGISTFTGSSNGKKWLFNIDVIRAFEALYKHIIGIGCSDIFMLALITSAMQCCNAKKDGKCLRYLSDWRQKNYSGRDLRERFKIYSLQMISDLQVSPLKEGHRNLQQGDSRQLIMKTDDKSVDLIILSPPYLNSFDYSDTYRPELFWGKYVKSNDELMKIRKQTLRSHVRCKWETKGKSDIAWVTDIVNKLKDKTDTMWSPYIPQMVSAYFYDMETVLTESYRVAKRNAQLWFVMSTSAYAGVEIPVDLILADIASKHGWELDSVNALRKLRTSNQCVDENKQNDDLQRRCRIPM